MLKPYAINPNKNANAKYCSSANCSFRHIATINEPSPEKTPFKKTIWYVFLFDKFFVQLFSNPQHKVANSTSIAPHEKLKAVISSKERKKLDTVINKIANHIFFETASLNTNNAIKEVQTISKLLSSEALDDALSSNPNISKMGAIISNAIIPNTLGKSFFAIFSLTPFVFF